MSNISNLTTTGLIPAYPAVNRTSSVPPAPNPDSADTALLAGSASSNADGNPDGSTSQDQDSDGSGASSSDSTSQGPFTSSEANSDYRTLLKDLQAGNFTSVQKDESKLQIDLQSTASHGSSSHHHHAALPTVVVKSSSNSATTGSYLNVTV